MNLSVGSRVKAHISTPYIDADGRGVEGAYAADYADCMKSPAEFHRILNGDGAEDALAKSLEEHCASLVERSKTFHRVMEAREADRKKALAADAATRGTAVTSLRERQIEVDQDADSAKLDAAYHKRLESDIDMDRYLRLLIKSDEARVRDRETSIADRHAKLRAVAEASRGSQRAAMDEEARRKAHLLGLRERLLVDATRQEEERAARALDKTRQDELNAILTQRTRDSELRMAYADLRVRQEADALQWEKDRTRAVHAATAAAADVSAKTAAMSRLVMEQAGQREEALYLEMKQLQVAFAEKAQELQDAIKHKYQVGSYLEHLMAAAMCTAERDTRTFHGLELLQRATLAPSSLTPATAPAFKGAATKTVATLTAVSEPIRSGSSGGSRRK